MKSAYSSTIFLLFFLCFFLPPSMSRAAQATLAWDPPAVSTDVTGYMIHYGVASGVYSESIDVGNTTSYTVSNLTDGQKYYFAVTAYNNAGLESAYSNEVSTKTPVQQCLIVISKPGKGTGTVSGTGINCGDTCLAFYNPGTVLSLSAQADPGSTFAGWSGGACSGTGLCRVTMNNATTVTAMFNLTVNQVNTYSITASVEGTGGIISPGGKTSVGSGGRRAFSIIPATGYIVAGVTIDGQAIGSVNSYTFESVTANHAIAAAFKRKDSPTLSGSDEVLYYPHIAANAIWQTEVAIINTSDQTVSGTLKAFSDGGNPVESKDVTLLSHGRRQIIIADEFTYHTDIGYIIFETDSDAVEGYTKFYQDGIYRAAIPAVKEVNTADIHIPHIASNTDWWTGISLVNTTSETKNLTLTFDNGQSVSLTFNPNEHKAFSIRSLFNDQPQLDIQSAVISNASGIIGLELFGSFGWGTQLEGILLTDNAATTLYYPHVAAEGGWTGVAAYNTSDLACTMTITPYTTDGSSLLTITSPSIGGREKYVGTVSDLGLPAGTAWFMIKSTQPLSGFELFGTDDGSQLASYTGRGGIGSREGVFPKIEKNGWTGIAFVNTEATAAAVTLIAYDDDGTPVDNQDFVVLGYGKKMFNSVEAIFSQAISSATYITYSSDRNVVGFQLNGSTDETMLDGLPALGGTN